MIDLIEEFGDKLKLIQPGETLSGNGKNVETGRIFGWMATRPVEGQDPIVIVCYPEGALMDMVRRAQAQTKANLEKAAQKKS